MLGVKSCFLLPSTEQMAHDQTTENSIFWSDPSSDGLRKRPVCSRRHVFEEKTSLPASPCAKRYAASPSLWIVSCEKDDPDGIGARQSPELM